MDAFRHEGLLTENRVMSEQFLAQLAYSEKMAELGRLAVGVIHEINTPLSVISAAAQLILREEGLSEQIIELLERIGGESQRLSQMSRGILTFSRLDSGGIGEADLNLVVRDVLQLLTYEIQKRSVTVRQECDYTLPILQVDGGRIKQIFINLVMNALQAMERGGTLTLRTSSPCEGECEISVADTGHGIPESAIGQIFEPFFTTKEAGEGTGLGLFVTREIVRSLGGSITVESRTGEGTCFKLRFPIPGPDEQDN